MIKRNCFILGVLTLLWSMVQPAYSQSVKPDQKHVIDVARYIDYNPDYLTIVDSHVVLKPHSNSFTPITWEPGTQGFFMGPQPGDIIVSVNDVSTKRMSPQVFYNFIDDKASFVMCFIHSGKEYTQEFIVRKTPPTIIEEWIPVNEFFCSHVEYPIARRFQDALKGKTTVEIREAHYKESSTICEEIQSQTFDFAGIQTYDYLIVGNDPLNDEKILDRLPKYRMKRDKKNPDVLFTIAKRAEDQISSSYVPPQQRTVYTGSVTTPQYNYILRQYEYRTQNNYITQVERGYTQTTKTSDFFLELAALDAKRLNDSLLTHAPIIWKMTTTRNVVNADIKPTEEMAAYASWGCFSLANREVNISRAFLPASGLIGFSNVVQDIIPKSRAEKAGFHKGDIIVKAKTTVRYTKEGEYVASAQDWLTKVAYKKISKSNPEVGFFNESRLQKVADDEYFPLNQRSRQLYEKRAEERISGRSDPNRRDLSYSCSYGWAPIYQNWEVTVLRNGKKIKLHLLAPNTYQVFDYYYLNP